MYGSYNTVVQISGTVASCLWISVHYRSQNKFYFIADWEDGDLYQASWIRFMKYLLEDLTYLREYTAEYSVFT